MSIGRRIQSLRKASRMTQQMLADKLSISRIYIQALESNRRTPSMKLLQRLADALSVEPSDLVIDLTQKKNTRIQLEELFTSGTLEIWYKSHQLADEEVGCVLRLIDALLKEHEPKYKFQR